jgi:hypothetical protein
MTMRSIALALAAMFASREANAACVIRGARPTEPLPTMLSGQEFSFAATPDCAMLRFTIRDTTLMKIPTFVGPAGPGLRAYGVALTESEWNDVVAASGATLTWAVTGRTTAGVVTRLVTTNDLNLDDPTTRDLSRADAKLVGEVASDYAGGSVSGPGDVDGDGRDDLLIGSWQGAANAAYLVLGPVTGTRDLSLADAKLVGEEADDGAGASVSGAGDVDDDGRDDLLIGAWLNDEGGYRAGAVYLVLGPVSGTLDLASADAKLVGEEAYDGAGYERRVSGAGDVDGNGHDDILIGAANDEGGTNAGAAYLVLGPVTGTLDLSAADAKLLGGTSDRAGSVAGAGDVDGDGLDDLLVGASSDGGSLEGAAYLVLGPVTGTVDLSKANAQFIGQNSDDSAGYDVSGAGDVDGDGHDDLLVGAFQNGEGGHYAGAAYVVLGPVTGSLDLSLADAKLVGEGVGDYAGSPVSAAGDMNDDGNDDVLVGAVNNDQAARNAGIAYLVLGPVTGTVDLSAADAKFVGEHGEDHAGYVAGAGDVDGDKSADLLVGAPWNDGYVGAAYLIYGGGL